MPASPATGALVDAHLGELSQAARKVFAALAEGIAPDDVHGFALFSDSDGADLTAAINTREDLAALIEHYSDQDSGIDWPLYLAWYPGEWTRTSDDLDPEVSADLKRVWQTIGSIRDEVEPSEAEFWPSIAFEAAFIAIGLAWEDGFFSDYPNAVRVLAVMDGDQDAEDVMRWLGDLNHERRDEVTAYVAQEFRY